MPTLKQKKKALANPQSAAGVTLVGWRGVTVEVPEDWSPTAVSGEGASGYVRIASPDTRVLEIKWEEARGSKADVPRALARYVKTLERAARKARQTLVWRERPKQLSAIRPQRQRPIPYAWEAGRKAYGCIWQCQECNRLVIAELVGEPGDDLSLAPAILRSIQEHGENSWTTWALYGFAVDAPSRFALEGKILRTGHQCLQFRERTRSIQADRWGLASVVLRSVDLKDWFLSQQGGRLNRYRYQFEEAEVNGHPALRLWGPERPLPGLMRALGALFSFSWPAWWIRGYVWACPQANKIFAITSTERKRDQLAEQVVGRMRCHEASGAQSC
ncbi:MAG: hypothetical protein HY320_06215 [Armatimonadetes bacterium]|nr:hypothetical protein [Armatimonadota bacterium]